MSVKVPPPHPEAEPSIFGFDWNEAPKDLRLKWLPIAFDKGTVLFRMESNHVVGVTLLTPMLDTAHDGFDYGAKGKAVFEEVASKLSTIMGTGPETDKDDPGRDSAFYSCLEVRHHGEEIFSSICTWKAWWGESPLNINTLFPNKLDSEVIVSIESSHQVSVSIGKPEAQGSLQQNVARGPTISASLSVPR